MYDRAADLAAQAATLDDTWNDLARLVVHAPPMRPQPSKRLGALTRETPETLVA